MLEAATFDCVLEVTVSKNVLEVVALEKVPTEVMKKVTKLMRTLFILCKCFHKVAIDDAIYYYV